jgi:hypothetical protein
MAFLQYGASAVDRGSIDRTREHARKIALKLHDNNTSPLSIQCSSTFADFGAAFPMQQEDFFATQRRSQESTAPSDSFISESGSLFGEKDPFGPSNGRSSSGVGSFDPNWPVAHQSMSTMPSNSSMQAKFASPEPKRQHAALSPEPPNSSSNAARRRSRTQMRMHSRQRTESDVGTTPPHSPNISRRSDSRDHVAHYQKSTTPRSASSTPRSAASTHRSGGSSTSGSEPNLFDPSNGVGFTFDAFGLDADQINQQVSAALNDFAGGNSSVGDTSSFFAEVDGMDDFAVRGWDSPAGSRSSTPVNQDGFVADCPTISFFDGAELSDE